MATHRGGTISKYRERQTIYAQGDPADALFYIISGTIKVIINSESGKEAVIAVLGADTFVGEGYGGPPNAKNGGRKRRAPARSSVSIGPWSRAPSIQTRHFAKFS